MNNFNVDGVSTSSPAFGNELERIQPWRESIEEVRFEYANSRAEFGARQTRSDPRIMQSGLRFVF